MDNDQVLQLTAQIVAAHVGHNAVPVEQLPSVIKSVYSTLSTVTSEPSETAPLEPAVPIKKSVFPEYIVCLEDGKKLKMLKRHLQTAYGMTPEQYREKWNLPRDYPMVAPAYADQRSTLAKKIGLGKGKAGPPRPAAAVSAESDDASSVPQSAKPKKPQKKTTSVLDVIDRARTKAGGDD